MDDYRPYSMIKVPSKGLYYQNKKDVFFVKFLSYEEEYILTDLNLMESGHGIKKVLENVIIDDFDVGQLMPGDVQAISLFLRSYGFGDKITLDVTCPKCKTVQEKEIRLSDLKMVQVEQLPNKGNFFELTLPHSKKIIKIRMPNFEEEMEAEKSGAKGFAKKLSQITYELEGEKDKRIIANAVSQMPMKDSRFLKDFLKKNTPGVDTSVEHTCDSCSFIFRQEFSAGYNFLTLPASYRDNMLEQLFSISHYSQGGITWSEAVKMPTVERMWVLRRLQQAHDERKKEEDKALKKAKGRARR